MMLFLLPYAVYLHTTTGLAQHFVSGLEYSRAETDRTVQTFPYFRTDAVWSDTNAQVLLFYLFYFLPMLALAVLPWGTVIPLAALAIAFNIGMLRDPLTTRLPDVTVPACLIAGCLATHALRGTWLHRGAALVVAALFLVGINAIGAPLENLDRAGFVSRPDLWPEHMRERVSEFQAPFAERQFPSRVVRALAPFLMYVDRCTRTDQRLFVAGEAPELYVFARRLYAGGQQALRSGFFSSLADQQRLVLRLREQTVPLAFVLTESDAERFPLVMDELRAYFDPLTEIPVEGQGSVRVRVSRRIQPSGVDKQTGLPCFT
jgi:hypothetical protein